MADDDQGSDDDEVRALAALRSMDAARRRKMVEKLERMAKEYPLKKPVALKVVAVKRDRPRK